MDATYISANSFTVAGDRTSEFVADRRVKLDCGTDGIKYAVVVSSSYSSPNTTVTIDESTLTNKLVTALYGIVQPGEYGSLPDHAHDGSEGSGGSLTISGSGSSTLLELTDTPSAYDDGKYLKSTVSGTEWATTSGGGGTSDHSALNELDYASAGHTGFASSVDLSTTSGTLQTQIDGKSDIDHTHTTFSGTFMHVDGDATVTGTMYAHAYDSYSPLVLKAAGKTVATGDESTGIVDFPYNPTVLGESIAVGVSWYLSDGIPSNSIGKLNDVAMDQNTGDIYKKIIASPSEEIFYSGVGGDDGYWKPGEFYNGNSDIYFGAEATSDHSFIRFPNINIPQGTTVTNVYVKFRAHGNCWNNTVNVNIYFENVDDAVAPINEAAANALSLTSAVAWNSVSAWNSGTWYNSVGITSILQLILNRDNWESGNAVQVVIKDNSSTAWAYRYFSAIEWSSGAGKAELRISYGALSWVKQYSDASAAELSTTSGTLQSQIDGKSDVQTFLDLTDTPTTYDDGKYLKSTTSGTEWVGLIGGGHTVVSGVSSTTAQFSSNQTDTSYYITATLKNIIDNPPSVYSYIVFDTTVSGFTVLFSSAINTGNYILDWHLMR